MSNFLIFKAAFNNSATPAIGTYTAEGATALFKLNASVSPDYYLYNTADGTAVQWFVPTAETTDFEFVADILTRQWTNRVTYFIIADSTGTTRLRMWSQYANWFFESSDSIVSSGTEYIGAINPTTSGGFGVFHQFRVRVRKLTASSSSVEVYVDGALKLTATAGAALVTCAKIGFVGGVNTFGPGTGAGIKNAYVYDLSGGDVIDRSVLSGAFNRFISWMKSKFALKSDIPTVNNATLTIQRNGTTVDTFTANASVDKTININTADDTKIPLAGSNAISGDLIPATTDAYDLGGVSYQWNNAYIKSLTISGVACGDILTHNVSEFVNVSGNQTIGGIKTFTSSPGVSKASDPFYHLTTTGYDKGSNPTSNMYSGIRFFCNPSSTVSNKITGGLDMVYYANGYNAIGLNVRNYDENSNHRFFTVSLRLSSDSTLPPDLVPSISGQINLGSSTAQWKDCCTRAINGINPGALSLPGDAYIDIDTTNYAWGSDFTFTPDYDGYCFLNIGSSSYSRIISLKTGRGEYYFSNQTDVFCFTFPVYKGKLVTILTNSSGTESVIPTIRVFSCQGNV